jgi:serine/threonine protein kinase
VAERIAVVCPKCKAVHRLELDARAGAKVVCENCGREIVVPEPGASHTATGQATLAGSADDRQITLTPPQEGTTMTWGGNGASDSVESLLAACDESAGRYVEQGFIGRGGMGEVALCVDRNIRRRVAMKRMLPSTAADPKRRARFVEEAQVTGQLQHPNIVPVYELEKDATGTVYFTMKPVEGRSLADLLEAVKQGRESPSLVELLQIFLKVCDGVAFAHSRGVVHRDLKPSNIMLGDYGEVLVMDWGLAKIMGRDDIRADELVTSTRLESAPELTMEGTALGTPAYMPPEQATGKLEQIDHRSDIYSLGAILYEILTLERAVEGHERTEVLLKAAAGRIVRPQERARGRRMPAELCDVAMKCLAKRREDRYPSVADLRSEIQLFLEGGEAWLPVCSFDFQDGRLNERFEAVRSEAEIPYPNRKVHWVSDREVMQASHGQARLARPPGRSPGLTALEWRGDTGEDVRVAATYLNEPGSALRISVSGDTSNGYRVAFFPTQSKLWPDRIWLETIARGRWEILQEGLIPLDPTQASYDIVVERSGQWVRAFVDGAKAIEFYDPLPLSGPKHRTFGLSTWTQGFTITRLEAWRRRPPDTVSVLEGGRALLQAERFAEAARFFGDQLSTPRGTALDDEARFLYGVSLEGMGATEEAIASHRKVAESSTPSLAAMALLRLARLVIARGDLGAAGRAAKKAKQADPSAHVAEPLRRAIVDLLRNPAPCEGPPPDPEGLAALADLVGRKLHAESAGIRSLDPIRGLPLTYLSIAFNPISSLAPLEGMPLAELSVANTKVADLRPLQGMPLKKLRCNATRVCDLTPLKGIQLTSLICDQTSVSDLEPLAGMPLEALLLGWCSAVGDLRPLAGMPLKRLNLHDCTPVSDLGPLRGMRLTWFDCVRTRVVDLGPLEGMPLEHLDVYDCRNLRDITPLAGTPLTWLSIGKTNVADLAPLEGMPLEHLNCEEIPATDLTPLEGMKLTELSFTPANTRNGIESIRGMKTLTRIGLSWNALMDASAFWRKYDAGEFK